MAIIVEEEKNRSNLAAVVGWIVILGIVLAAVYYIFFAAPAAVIVTPPAGFQNISAITQVNFNPASVTSSTSFQALKQYVSEPTSTGPASVGRPDPFLLP
jgi:hypothetical protein